MPVPLWSPGNKAEAKYNVVTEFPQLGLHAAAVSGNVGLVEYALEHGQPINSVLDGVLPIHAASAGGHPQVVKKLIEHGADVNAPRLPRRYFSDRNRDASAPIVGTSGSTPLHFAAANGNTEVVTLLLLHGAHPDLEDKYGVTPEELARQYNWVECAQQLHDWMENKDRDLRERETLPNKTGNGAASSSKQGFCTTNSPDHDPSTPRRRLHVKQSIDTALNILKTASHSETSLKPHPTNVGSPPLSPMKPFGEYSFDPDGNGNHSPIDPGSRRPSLPHILQPPSTFEEANRKKPLTAPRMRRPRSAGTGADRSPEHDIAHVPYGRGGSGRKLGSKLSLLALFKKSQQGDGAGGDTIESSTSQASASTTALPLTPTTPSSFPTLSPTSGIKESDAIYRSASRTHSASDPTSKGFKITPQPKLKARPSASFLELDSSVPPSPVAAQAPLPSAVDLHNALAQQRQGRDRSRSNATTATTFSDLDTGSEDDTLTRNPKATTHYRLGSAYNSSSTLPGAGDSKSSLVQSIQDGDKGTPLSGILRGHQRTGSYSQGSPSPARALRFDSTVGPERSRKEPNTSSVSVNEVVALKSSSSSHSLRKQISNRDSSERSQSQSSTQTGPPTLSTSLSVVQEKAQNDTQAPNPPKSSDLTAAVDDHDDDDEVDDLKTSGFRSRGKSFGSVSQSSLSPVFTNDNATVDTISTMKSDFPFSIRHPPPVEDVMPSPPTTSDTQLQIPDIDRRGRGDSISSTWTADSGNMPQYSTSGSTIGSTGSPTISTPNGDNLSLPNGNKFTDDGDTYDHLVRQEHGSDGVHPYEVSSSHTGSTLNERRAHSPMNIVVGAISSHAEADALVEKTRQDILELASARDFNGAEVGTTPLSARLAAYGESLAIQRKLREQEEESLGSLPNSPQRRQFDGLTPTTSHQDAHRNGVERQLSLDKSGSTRARTKKKDPRRPSTADGLSGRAVHNSFFPGEPSRTHQMSLSVSPPGIGYTSNSFDGRDTLQRSQHQQFFVSASPTTPSRMVPDSLGPVIRRTSPTEIEEDVESSTQLSCSESDLNAEIGSQSSTVRHHGPSSSPGIPRVKPHQIRNASSAKKLNRMGFTVVEQAARPPHPSSGKLFGGFKSIMQTLKGKS